MTIDVFPAGTGPTAAASTQGTMMLFRLTLVLVAVVGAGIEMPSASAAEPARDRCVVLISIDGLANFYLDDPLAEIPTLRRLAAQGARADGMVCSFPTVTWPNHTTLVTGVSPGKHGVIGNNYLDRSTGQKVAFIPDPLFDKEEIVKVPTVYDVAHEAGLVTAGVIWPATRNAKTLDWTVPDMAGDDAWTTYGTPHWMAELRADGIPVDKHGTWVRESSGGVQRDWLYTRLAAHLFEKHPPQLMLVHLIEVDHVQHKFGPRTPEAYWAVNYADERLRSIVESAGRSPYADKTTFVVVSDHGFFPIERDICPNVRLRQLGYLQADGNNITSKKAICVSQGGGCMVYVLAEEGKAAIVQELQRELARLEGVQAVYTAGDFEKIGQSVPESDHNAPDLWLAAETGFSFAETHTGEDTVIRKAAPAGTHGFLPDQTEMLGTCVISGYGVKPGQRLGKIRNVDIAPTMAALLGLELKNVDGRVLQEGLQRSPKSR